MIIGIKETYGRQTILKITLKLPIICSNLLFISFNIDISVTLVGNGISGTHGHSLFNFVLFVNNANKLFVAIEILLKTNNFKINFIY